jgi:hypothetical protein
MAWNCVTRIAPAKFWRQSCQEDLGQCVVLKESLGLVMKSSSTSQKMLVVTWLVVFALVGFSPVDTIPRPTPNRISCIKPNLADQRVIDKPFEIKHPISRLPNCYHDSHPFTGDICTQKTTTHNGALSKLQSSQFCSQKRTYDRSSI